MFGIQRHNIATRNYPTIKVRVQLAMYQQLA